MFYFYLLFKYDKEVRAICFINEGFLGWLTIELKLDMQIALIASD